jgi:hypothetical protein
MERLPLAPQRAKRVGKDTDGSGQMWNVPNFILLSVMDHRTRDRHRRKTVRNAFGAAWSINGFTMQQLERWRHGNSRVILVSSSMPTRITHESLPY